MRNKRTHAFLTVLMLLITLSLHAQSDMARVPLDPDVRYGTLENGLTYYIRHNAKPEHRAEFYIAQRVGSIQEEPSQKGLAHFLEHMAFNGTQHFPGDGTAPGIVQWCESHAIQFGTNLNAYTSTEETVYNISGIPTESEAVLDSCLLILNDWSSFILLRDQDIDDERGVITEEWRSRNSGIMRIYTEALKSLYPGTRYADCMPIGSIDVIRNFSYQTIKDYYRTWYHPGNQGLVLVGDFDAQMMEEKVRRLFGAIPRREGAPERVDYEVPDNTEPLVYVGSDKELDTPLIELFIKHEATPRNAKDNLQYMATQSLLEIISSMLNTRLSEILEKADPPFISVSSAYGTFFVADSKDAFEISASCKQDGVQAALGAILEELERVRRFGFTKGELDRAKADYLQALESAYNERANIKSEELVNEYVRHFLQGEPAPGIEYAFSMMSQILPSIPLEAVNALAMNGLITRENNAVMIAVPESAAAKAPGKDEVLAMLKARESLQVAPYVDTVGDQALLEALPKAGRILSEQPSVFGTELLELSNGVKVYLKQTDFKDDEILLGARSLGGLSQYGDSEILDLSLVSSTALVGGLGTFSQTDLTKVLAGKDVSVNFKVSELTESLSASSSVKDLESMFQLLYLTVTSPRKDEAAFSSYKTRLKASLESQQANPLASFSDSLSTFIYSHHPRVLALRPEMVDRLDYDRILAIYRDRFSDFSDFSFCIAGHFDKETIRPLICQYLASLPAGGRKEQFVDRKQEMAKGILEHLYRKPQETPMATTAMVYSGKVTYSLRNALMMSLTSEILNAVMTEEIREKEGGTYGVSVSGSLRNLPRQEGILQLAYQTDPDKRDHLNGRIYQLIETLAKEGPQEGKLQNAKDYLEKRFKDNQKENSYFLNLVDEWVLNGTDMQEGYLETLSSISGGDIRDFTEALLAQGNRATVTMTVPKD